MKIENNCLVIEVNSLGAELKRIYNKINSKEYLWRGGDDWGRSSPVLFPNIGMMADNVLFIDGIVYPCLPHGFARDLDFELACATDTSLSYVLKANNQTKKYYPYNFDLEISYRLRENKLVIDWKVINKEKRDMYFSIGAHPAFNLLENTSLDDYVVKFDKKITPCIRKVLGRLLSSETYILGGDIDCLQLSAKMFKEDALVFENSHAESIILSHKTMPYSIKVDFKDFPVFALWTNPARAENAKFLCIEPWCGINSFDKDKKDEIENKHLINKLSSGGHWEKSYTIEVF